MGTAGKRGTRCKLCGGVAAVHCAAAAVHCTADSAFLCLRCDAKVHGTNFLASRHRKQRLGAPAATAAGSESEVSSASSSSCVSTTNSTESVAVATPSGAATTAGRKQRRRRSRAEAVLEGWAERMGFVSDPAHRRAMAAARAPGAGPGRGRVSLCVAMAATLWAVEPAGPQVPAAAALMRPSERDPVQRGASLHVLQAHP